MSSRAGKGAALVLAAVVAAGVLTAIGRWERGREGRRESHGFRIVERLVGPLDSPTLSGFRVFPAFDCLTYRRGTNPLALELCVDHAGRVVEAIDRRRDDRRIWSLRFDPSRSSVRVSEPEVRRLLRKMTE
jgi:hypothetical protein